MTTKAYTPWQTELLAHITAYSATYSASQYHAMATDSDIQSFLEEEPLWDNNAKKWTSLLTAATHEDLKISLEDVVNAVIAKLGKEPGNGLIARKAYLTNGTNFEHRERRPCTGGSSPDLVVKGTGPSFEDPARVSDDNPHALAFSNAATFIEIRQESQLTNDDADHVEQSSVYSRQVFIQQPNRRFVRSLLISEEWCQIFHYDRSGAQYTLPFHIHENVNMFIRTILGVSSYDEFVLGLDTAVQWTIEGGRKVGGTITVTDVAGAQTQYKLCDVEPVFCRYEILGRGTTGWRVRSAAGVELFVKDCWRPEEDQPEYEILQEAAGVDGVPQLVAHEVEQETTARLRANGDKSWSVDNFSNRVSTRIVMEYCGKSIASFQSQYQVVSAMRDAISAHQILVNEHEILHRDISQNNVLLGGSNARIGGRGKLIDFDMAFCGPRPLSQTPSDPKAGTPFYTSVAMLYSQSPGAALCLPFHNQLDDLESFYYVLYDLMFTWAGVGVPSKEPSPHLQSWRAETTTECAIYKKAHFLGKLKVAKLPSFWSPATVQLLREFRDIISELVFEKDAAQDLYSEIAVEMYEALLDRADEFYAKILAIFDKAIKALEQDNEGASPPLSSEPPNPGKGPSSPSPSPSSHHSTGPDRTHQLPTPTAPVNSIPDALNQTGASTASCHDAADTPCLSSLAVSSELETQAASPTAVGSPTSPKACDDRAPQPVTPPKIRKCATPSDSDDDAYPKGRRVRPTKLLAASRKKGWVRTSPHRTRAWVKANLHLV